MINACALRTLIFEHNRAATQLLLIRCYVLSYVNKGYSTK